MVVNCIPIKHLRYVYVVQQFLCYNTPENNSIMERIQRAIAGTALAMLVDSRLPERFWEDMRFISMTEYHLYMSPPMIVPGCHLKGGTLGVLGVLG